MGIKEHHLGFWVPGDVAIVVRWCEGKNRRVVGLEGGRRGGGGVPERGR
jgi:hypothetical protein